MKKVISVLSLALMTSFAANAATGDTSEATAQWQGVIPGVAIPDGTFIITGKDGERAIPIGTLIDLEGHVYTAPVPAGPGGTPAAIDEIVGALQPATWAVDEAKFYAAGVEIQGIAWNIYDNQELLASINGAGVLTTGTASALTTADSAIELKIKSDTASHAEIDQYAGDEATVAVTILATSA
ncbi:hypothetical protein L3V77_11225 [Vibrio sp. DW001]|uniref:hypothetical protein n=1 Tax=Vibrio sp. DW001 TaxID=2912315 RepID=UPI0023B1816A|nr:hypothetical protein [Vibrio sp. DW001]WED25635.1 hypothetical protein L3V77_11225 [Vibrio sp. DW001]